MAEAIAGVIGGYFIFVIAIIIALVAAIICIFIITYKTHLINLNMYTLYEQNEELLARIRQLQGEPEPAEPTDDQTGQK